LKTLVNKFKRLNGKRRARKKGGKVSMLVLKQDGGTLMGKTERASSIDSEKKKRREERKYIG